MRKITVGYVVVLSLVLMMFLVSCGPSSDAEPQGSSGLTLVSNSPAVDATEVDLGAVFTATLSGELDPLSVDKSTLTARGLNDLTGIEAVVSYDPVTMTITCDPVYELRPDTTYVVTLAATVEGLDGSTLAEEVTWSFTTGTLDITPPDIARLFPPDGGYIPPGYINAAVYYTEDGVTAVNGTFTINCEGEDVFGTPNFASRDDLGVFAVEVPFVLGEECVASASAVLVDSDNNVQYVSKTWSFMIDYPRLTGTPVSASSAPSNSTFDVIVPVDMATSCASLRLYDGARTLGSGYACKDDVTDSEITVPFRTTNLSSGDYLIFVYLSETSGTVTTTYTLDTETSAQNYSYFTSDGGISLQDSGIPLAEVSLYDLPDMTVSILAVVDNLTSSDIDLEVCNDGLVAVGAFDVSVFLSDIGTASEEVAQIASLDTSSCVTDTVTISAGDFAYERFYAVADFGDFVIEADEQNNTGSYVIRDAGEIISSPNVPVVIVDRSTVTSTLSVESTITALKDISVTIDIDHTWDSDMTLKLISPSGTAILLASRRGSGGDNYDGTIFDDFAFAPISSGLAPFADTYRPEESLLTLEGENPNGIWTLSVQDHINGDSGLLNSWSISIW